MKHLFFYPQNASDVLQFQKFLNVLGVPGKNNPQSNRFEITENEEVVIEMKAIVEERMSEGVFRGTVEITNV